MRTKALLLSAAICAACVPTALAQVYSVNAVGYINMTVPAGEFMIIANQLDNGQGNALADVIPGPPQGTRVYAWNVATQGYVIATWNQFGGPNFDGAWEPEDAANQINMAPGVGAFMLAPAASDVDLTFVGDVPQGMLTVTYPTDGGLALISSMVPQAGTPQDLKFTPAQGDRIYQWAGGAYEINTWNQFGGPNFDGAWEPNDVTIGVGEGFFLRSSQNTGSWTRDFDINDPTS